MVWKAVHQPHGTHLARCRVACAANSGSRLFVFGLGYTGTGLVRQLQMQGDWHCAGTCRTQEKADALTDGGVRAHCYDPDNLRFLDSSAALRDLRAATHILTTIAPVGDFDRDPVLLGHAGDLRQLGAAGALRWVGYLSSTSVYGDWGGACVDERSELRARGGRGAPRARAEAAWLALHAEHGLPVHAFRLGGIYGPGRSALDAAAVPSGAERAGQARRARQRFTARCHVADVCAALAASMAAPCPGAVYNVVDDDPAPRGQVVAYARQLLGAGSPARPPLGEGAPQVAAPPPAQPAREPGARQELERAGRTAAPAAAPAPGGGAQRAGGGAAERPGSRGALEEKRVSNAKLKGELGVRLAFPTYREGLAAIAAGDLRPFR